MSTLVLTGAAGRLGSHLREPLARLADTLISSDQVDSIGALHEGERYTRANLENLDEMCALLDGADMVVHFGAIGDEAPFETLLGPNFIGAYNVWEAAHRNGLRRVVYASSIHAVGMHPRTRALTTDAPHRPDTFYGLAKCFAEDLGRLYWDKRSLEAVCLRIASCAAVTSARALGTWLSIDDLVQLVTRAIDTPSTGFSVVYGVSDNDRSPFDNTAAGFLGYRPKDNAETFATNVLADAPPEPIGDATHACIGGPFAAVALGDSGLANMDIIDDTKRT